jgi:hypothetical protein
MESAASSTPTQNKPPIKRHVKNYLLDAGLQLRFASYLVVIATGISIAMGVMLWRAYREASKVASLGDEHADSMISDALAHDDQVRMVWLAGGLVLVVLCILVFAIVVTHRIAGPALFLARTAKNVGQGNLARPRALRDGDMLVELAKEVGNMVDALRAQEQRESEALAAAAAKLKGGPEAELAESLEKLAAEKQKRYSS